MQILRYSHSKAVQSFLLLFLVSALSVPCVYASSVPKANGGIFSLSSDRLGGGHHGNGTDILGAAADFVVRNHSGAIMRLGVDQRICAMQRRLGANPLRSRVFFVAERMSVQIDASPEAIETLLTSPDYCERFNQVFIRPVVQASSVPSIPFFVDAAGIPVSSRTPVFDLCIRGQAIFLPLIRANPDRVQRDHRGKVFVGASCQKYSLHDGRWRHPDYPEMEYFTLTLKPQVFVTVPAPYVIAPRVNIR